MLVIFLNILNYVNLYCPSGLEQIYMHKIKLFYELSQNYVLMPGFIENSTNRMWFLFCLNSLKAEL